MITQNFSYEIGGYVNNNNNNIINIINNNCNNSTIVIISSIFICTLILYKEISIFLYYISLILWSHHSYFLWIIIITIKQHASRQFMNVMWNNQLSVKIYLTYTETALFDFSEMQTTRQLESRSVCNYILVDTQNSQSIKMFLSHGVLAVELYSF
jgi:hypothetical protein